MKKLLILFFSLIIFSFSFSFNFFKTTYLKGINLERIEERLLNDDFKLSKDKELYFFKRKEDNYSQIVTISFDKEKPYNIEIISSDLHSVPNEEMVMNELISMTIHIKDNISDETLKTGLTKIVNEMPSRETRAITETHKVENYFIKVNNRKDMKTITIFCK